MTDPVLLLTECGAGIGFGHLTRCLSIAQAFRSAGIDAQIWLASDDAISVHLPEFVTPVQWYGLPGNLRAQAAGARGVLLDSFNVDAEAVEQIARVSRRFAVIDDFPRRRYSTGVVIDWTIGAEQKRPSAMPPEVSFLLGSRYCALRPEFQSFASRAFPASPRSVLVTFGGSDIRSLTTPVLAMLEAEFPDLEKLVVLGPGSQMTPAAASEKSKTSFYVGADAACMQSLMARADLAISGGGQTLYELASQGLPPVVVSLTADQEDDVRGFTQAGFGIDAGSWQTSGLLDRLALGIRELWPAALRERHSAAGRNLVDGQGAERLVSAVLNAWS